MSVVEPFAPGHIETYRLDTEGRAFLEGEAIRYHRIGEEPAYTTFEVKLGKVKVLYRKHNQVLDHCPLALCVYVLQPVQQYLFSSRPFNKRVVKIRTLRKKAGLCGTILGNYADAC